MRRVTMKSICLLLALAMGISFMPAATLSGAEGMILDVGDVILQDGVAEGSVASAAGFETILESPPIQIAEVSTPAPSLSLSQPIAAQSSVAVGEGIQWTFGVAGAVAVWYAVSCDGQLLEEASLPTDISSFTWHTGQAGSHTLTIYAQDPQGGTVSQTSGPVQAQAAGMNVSISANQTECTIGDMLVFTAQYTGGMSPHSAVISVSRNGVSIGDFIASSAEVLLQMPGQYTATLTVTDASGQTATAHAEAYCSGALPEDAAALAPSIWVSGYVGQDMAAIAASEIGYTAGVDEAGQSGYTKYGHWYDLTYNNGAGAPELIYGVWNATFVSYCAYFAGAALRPATRADALQASAAEDGLYENASFIARVGDVAFLTSDNGTRAGIVVEVSGDTMLIVEGDGGGAVVARTYGRNDGQIISYARIAPVVYEQPEETFRPESILDFDASAAAPVDDAEGLREKIIVTGADGAANPDDIESSLSDEVLVASDAAVSTDLFIATPEPDSPGVDEVLDIVDDASPEMVIDAAAIILTVQAEAYEIALGDTIRWTVTPSDSDRTLTYRYTVYSTGEPVLELESMESTLEYLPEVTGSYVLSVQATDNADTSVEARDEQVLVLTAVAEAAELMPYAKVYEGGGELERSESVVPQSFTMRMSMSSLNDLEVAYLTCSASTLLLNTPVTWTIHATGGTGGYEYMFGLFYQEFSASIQDTVDIQVLREYSSDHTFTYTPTKAGRYVILAYIRDSSNNWLFWESPVYLTSGANDANNPTTVAGKVQYIIQNFTNAGMTNTQKVKAFHDWLANNASYDNSYTYYHAEGVLLIGKGVCQSYAQAFRLLCLEVGIPCIFVTGEAGGVLHAWNLVYLDGVWRHIDCTWGDAGDGKPPRYNWYLLTDDEMSKDHSWNSNYLLEQKDAYRIDGIYPTDDTFIGLTELSLMRASFVLYPGDEAPLVPNFVPANATDQNVTWTSSNPAVATVSSSGVVRAVSVGSAVITVKGFNNVSTTATIVVSNDPSILRGISLDPSGSVELNINGSLTIAATKVPDTAEGALTWSSSNPAVAEVDQSGKVTPKQDGTTRITVTGANGVSTLLYVNVYDPTLAKSITLDRTGSIELSIHGTLKLNATISPNTATTPVIWNSSNSAVAEVDQNGKVTPKKTGEATISVSSNGITASVKVLVYDPNAVTSITFTNTGSGMISLDEPFQIAATTVPAGAVSSLTWSSSNTAIATVDANGRVTPVKAGQVTITATSVNNITYSVTLRVVDPKVATGITLNRSGTVQLGLGNTLPLTATVSPSTAVASVVWRSTDTSVASVNEQGLVTPLKVGTTTIIATVDGTVLTASVTISVVDLTKPTGIALDRYGTVDLDIKETLSLKATLIPNTAQSELSWTSSTPSVATVSSAGVVTPVKAGTTVITVTALATGVTASVTINVVEKTDPVTRVTLSHSGTVDLGVGSTLLLSATLTPSTSVSALTWSSAAPSVAMVNDQGVVTALREGYAAITVTALNGNRTASVNIHVVDPTKTSSISLNMTGTVNVNTGDRLSLLASLFPSTSQSTLTWRSSSPSVASVDENGVVTAHKEGVTTISVTSDDTKRVASVRLEVKDPNKPTGITLSETGTVELELGKTLTLNATLTPSTAQSSLTWRSSSTSIATVDANGVVTPLREGVSAISVTADSTRKTATVNVRVIDPAKPTGITLEPSEDTLLSLAETLTLKAQLVPATAEATLTWRSSSTSVATVDAEGVVTPVKVGTTTVTVTADKTRYSASVRIQVVDPAKPAQVTLSRTEDIDMELHDYVALRAAVLPETAEDVALTWQSSKPSVASVDERGVIASHAEGTATITVAVEGTNIKASVKVKVVKYMAEGNPNRPDSALLMPLDGEVGEGELPSLRMANGETQTLQIEFSPESAHSANTWHTSDPWVATVDDEGVVVANGPGTAVVSILTRNGKVAHLLIDVSD
ncbi:Ig-like domain-containing protein [Eubacteriales bacterium OttesenSCG-928-A19]|nr:Ig-like domain-containing protein [Eubacteriales bacterium OttesenSCG-928-A19]